MPGGVAALVVETAGDLTGVSIDDHGAPRSCTPTT
jgi:hypothetical protein